MAALNHDLKTVQIAYAPETSDGVTMNIIFFCRRMENPLEEYTVIQL